MSFLEKDRTHAGTGWFVGIIGVIAISQIFWNLYTLFLYLLAALVGIQSEANVLTFFASALGLAGGLLLLIGLVLLARRIPTKQPWLALGAIALIAKNVVEALQGLLTFMTVGDKTSEGLHLAAFTIGSDVGQLIFWCFVLWLCKTWVPHLMLSKDKKAEGPKLMGAQ